MTLTPMDRRPAIDGVDEFNQSKMKRDEATGLAYDPAIRPAPSIRANPEEIDNLPRPISNFTKGLPHTLHGNVGPLAYEMFVKALRMPADLCVLGGFPAPLGFEKDQHPTTYDIASDTVPGNGTSPAETPVTQYFHEATDPKANPVGTRKWESPQGGLNSDISGPSIGGVSLPPAPALGSSELCAEMAEVYAMALMRDIPFSELNNPAQIVEGSTTVGDIVAELASLPWLDPNGSPVSSELTKGGKFQKRLTDQENRRRAARWQNGAYSIDALFRGSTEGARKGPYLSQFMMQGTARRKEEGNPRSRDKGLISFGTQTIDQRNQPDPAGIDYMVSWLEWLDVQNGANFKAVPVQDPPRFLTTLRDLAAYVHIDQLYQAYFNAALLLIGPGSAPKIARFDQGIPNNDARENTTRQGFATWGGPHLLDLLASVSSRGLKIVRRQKFQIHRRARPEVLAARLTLAHNGKRDALGAAGPRVKAMLDELTKRCPKLMAAIASRNAAVAGNPAMRGLAPSGAQPTTGIDPNKNLLLPMAFAEGSPMHPAYGAGHATVAGACVTVLKALLNTVDNNRNAVTMADFGFPGVFESDAHQNGTDLKPAASAPLTVTGELDKLAANISIGRNMAGVHYYTDYYESLRLGERVAVGILQEHLQTSPEAIHLHMFDFNGRLVKIAKGEAYSSTPKATIEVFDEGKMIDTADWWTENVSEYET
ncbi:MAG: vanadium-dependent haloperoxidase [Pseudomonadota bacterium]